MSFAQISSALLDSLTLTNRYEGKDFCCVSARKQCHWFPLIRLGLTGQYRLLSTCLSLIQLNSQTWCSQCVHATVIFNHYKKSTPEFVDGCAGWCRHAHATAVNPNNNSHCATPHDNNNSKWRHTHTYIHTHRCCANSQSQKQRP